MTNAKDGKKGSLRNFLRALVSPRKTCAGWFRQKILATSLTLAISSKVPAAPLNWWDPLLTESEWTHLLTALIYVESRGIITAHNKKEDARGCLQIRASVVEDFNFHNRLHVTHDDMFRAAHSRMVCRWYLEYYGRKWVNRYPEHGQCVQQALARIWNGGPNGPTKGSTIHYWHLVSQRLENL